LGHRWHELLHLDDVEGCRDVYEKAFAGRDPYQLEYRLRRHDGEYRWILSVGVPRFDVDGSFVDVRIDVHFENIPKALPADVSVCLYRVLQEGLRNVVKHGWSRHAQESLNGQTNTINLTVKDSGVGFLPREAMRGPGLGLSSIKERLKLVGGNLSIHSQRGVGTTIHAVAPFRIPAKPAN
jgi:glucose-6-phosphate-specific signal transduction histidine kinase